MIAIRQLCFDGEIVTDFVGVRFETALFNLQHVGWGVARCGCGWAACDHAPLRLRLRGRTWIEDVAKPAVCA